jgi:hypothetical protein
MDALGISVGSLVGPRVRLSPDARHKPFAIHAKSLAVMPRRRDTGREHATVTSSRHHRRRLLNKQLGWFAGRGAVRKRKSSEMGGRGLALISRRRSNASVNPLPIVGSI